MATTKEKKLNVSMRWCELKAGDLLILKGEPEYVVLATNDSRVKLLQTEEGVIFDYVKSSAHVEAYGYVVTRNDEVVT